MRLLFIVLLLLAFQPTEPARIRLLLRDEADHGVAEAMLTLRTAAGQTIELATDANGVAVSGALVGQAVWLTGGRLAGGQTLIADSYPKDAGFRLALIPSQTRDALLRLDGQTLVLDPDMILSPGEPGELVPPPPPALTATVLPLSATAPTAADPVSAPPAAGAATPAPAAAQASSTARAVLGWIVGVGMALMALAFLIGLARRGRP